MEEPEIYVGSVSADEALLVLKQRIDRFLDRVDKIQEATVFAIDLYRTNDADANKKLQVFRSISELGEELGTRLYDIESVTKELLLEYEKAHLDDQKEE